MEQIIAELKPLFEKTIEFLKDELAGLRTGRANVAVIENIPVECYGSKTPLKNMAAISVLDAHSMTVQPWDKTVIKDVEKAISQAGNGLGVSIDGPLLRLSVPPMTEERRREIVKILNEKIESARVSLRDARDKIREKVSKQFKNKDITEDDKYGLFEDIDKLTTEYNAKIKDIGQTKETEIMAV